MTSFSTNSMNNVTDAPVGDSGTVTDFGSAWPVDTIPGTTYGSSRSAAFMAPGSDWRPKMGGPLVGTGQAFGAFNQGCETNQNPCPATENVDSPDLVGIARPQGGHYDIGAIQSWGQ